VAKGLMGYILDKSKLRKKGEKVILIEQNVYIFAIQNVG
jgi:hypothetical protein